MKTQDKIYVPIIDMGVEEGGGVWGLPIQCERVLS